MGQIGWKLASTTRGAMLGVILMGATAVAGVATPPVVVRGGPTAMAADELPGPPPDVVQPARVALPLVPDALHGELPPLAMPAVVVAPPTPVAARRRDLSIDALNTCHAALGARRYAAAITACKAAVAAWDGNHLAWYGWASAHVARDDWAGARVAIARAVALRPDLAMYQMLDGIARYRGDQPETARLALERALASEPRLWRAHYFLACLARDLQAPRSAAAHFTAAIAANPRDPASYVALSELYRAADQLGPALAVAELGTAQAPRAANVWFEVAMAHDAGGDGDAALAAIDRAIALRSDDASLRLARARLYFQRRDIVAMRAELVAIRRDRSPGSAAAARQAARLLAGFDDGTHMVADVVSRACSAIRGCFPVKISNLLWMGDAWTLPTRSS